MVGYTKEISVLSVVRVTYLTHLLLVVTHLVQLLQVASYLVLLLVVVSRDPKHLHHLLYLDVCLWLHLGVCLQLRLSLTICLTQCQLSDLQYLQ